MTKASAISTFSPLAGLAQVVVAVGLGFGIPAVAAIAASELSSYTPNSSLLPWLYLQHGLQGGLAIAAIFPLRRRLGGDYGLRWPKGRSYAGLSLLVGSGFGLLSCLVLGLVSGRPPTPD